MATKAANNILSLATYTHERSAPSVLLPHMPCHRPISTQSSILNPQSSIPFENRGILFPPLEMTNYKRKKEKKKKVYTVYTDVKKRVKSSQIEDKHTTQIPFQPTHEPRQPNPSLEAKTRQIHPDKIS